MQGGGYCNITTGDLILRNIINGAPGAVPIRIATGTGFARNMIKLLQGFIMNFCCIVLQSGTKHFFTVIEQPNITMNKQLIVLFTSYIEFEYKMHLQSFSIILNKLQYSFYIFYCRTLGLPQTRNMPSWSWSGVVKGKPIIEFRYTH